MQLGALVPFHDPGGDPDTVREYARGLEAAGLSERRYEVRLSRLPAVSIVFTSLVAGRRVRRISVGGLP